MFDWLKHKSSSRAVLGFAARTAAGQPDHAADLRAAAEAAGAVTRLELTGDPDALVAHPAFAACPLAFLAAPESEIVSIAARVASARAAASAEMPFVIAALAEDPLAQIGLRDADAALPSRHVRLRPVSRTAMLARQVLADTALPDRVLRLVPGAGFLPIVIAGAAGPMAAQLLLALLRLLHLPGIAPMVMLAGPGMEALLERLRAGLPELDAIGRVTASPNLTSPATPALILALPGAPDDAALRALDPSGVAAIVRPVLPGWREAVAPLAGGAHDRVAQSIHNLHLEERRAAGHRLGDQPSLASWEELPERFREASRHQASHIALKLRFAGARGHPPHGQAADLTSTGTFAWTEAELQALAFTEHDRWGAVARAEGWSFGPARDDAAKRTPLLVPFKSLTQEIRDLDVLPVRAAPRQLAAAGRLATRDIVLAARSGTDQPREGFASGMRAALTRLIAVHPGQQLVLRIDAVSPLAHAAALAALENDIPVQLALRDEPAPDALGTLAKSAERIAIGAAVAHLSAPLAGIGLGDVPRASADLFHLDADGRPMAG